MAFSITSAAELVRWFVSSKLAVETNYDWWPETMACEIESHGMQGFTHGTFKTLEENGNSKKKIEMTTVECKRSDALVTEKISILLTKPVMIIALRIYTVSIPTNIVNELVVGIEEWMKKTAESYTIIVACINTIVFAAAITGY